MKINKNVTYRINKSKCAGCGACLGICGEIIKIEDGRAVINEGKCQQCGQCVEICPFGAIEEVEV